MSKYLDISKKSKISKQNNKIKNMNSENTVSNIDDNNESNENGNTEKINKKRTEVKSKEIIDDNNINIENKKRNYNQRYN